MSRRSALGALTVACLFALSACASGSPQPTAGHRGSAPGRQVSHALKAAPAGAQLKAIRVPWRLPVAISRAVVVASGRDLLVAGGLTASQSSASGAFRLDPRTGSLSPDGNLALPVHDAAGALIHGRLFVFGGGASSSSNQVQTLMAGSAGVVAAHLPTVRSDLVAQRVGSRIYLLGGYDGTSPLPGVLVTSDGRHFHTVASLPVPVRYPAVTEVNGRILLFGGETGSGNATSVIQLVDPATGRARIVGHLPKPVMQAAAFTLGGAVYVAGGLTANAVSDLIWRFSRSNGDLHLAGRLPYSVADAGTAVLGGRAYLVGGETPKPTRSTIRVSLTGATSAVRRPAPAPAAPPPFVGDLLIADRGNNRLLLVNSAKHIIWRYPSATRPVPPQGFYFPDDAFFTHHGTGIITNEEDNNTIVQLGFPSGKVTWRYGHPHVAGSAQGYLHQPDDAYLLRNGQVVVADALNCRILFINADKKIALQLGTTGTCTHQPPAMLGYPNGDTPLANGNILVSEINGSYITELTPTGRLVWSVHLPIAYPSDPQQLAPNRFLVADYAKPGGIYIFNRAGRILWSYRPRQGRGMLNHPSLAERLPNGLIAVTDDYRDRVVIINQTTRRIVWQYGRTGVAGRSPGHLNTPDGFDLIAPNHTTPTHPTTG